MRALVLVMPMATAAQAAPVAEGLELDTVNHKLIVRDGKQWAPLGEDADTITAVRVDAKRRTASVTIDSQNDCQRPRVLDYTLGNLHARIENVAGFQLHVKKDFKGAIPHYEKAVAFDASWKVPALNLAGARTSSGDLDGAIRALAPRLAAEPIATFVDVASDPELAPLLQRAELRAIAAAHPGTAGIDAKTPILFSADKQLLAMTLTQPEAWATCSQRTTIELRAVGNATPVAEIPIEDYGESQGTMPCTAPAAKIASRTAAANAMLGTLGFAAARVVTGAEPTTDDGLKIKVYIPDAKLGLVLEDGTMNVLRGNDVVGSATTRQNRIRGVWLVPDLHVLVVRAGESYPECGNVHFATEEYDVIPVR